MGLLLGKNPALDFGQEFAGTAIDFANRLSLNEGLRQAVIYCAFAHTWQTYASIPHFRQRYASDAIG
jgi:hypothetical protein